MKYDAIPNEDHINRYVTYTRLITNPDTDEVLGISPAAFQLRPERGRLVRDLG